MKINKKSYKDLNVWQKAVDFAEEIYRVTEKFPTREHYGLAAQIRKSAISIASNIAEGSGRGSDKEFRQFLIIARGSAAELQTQMLIANRLQYISSEVYVSLSKNLNEIGKMLNGLKESIAYGIKLKTND